MKKLFKLLKIENEDLLADYKCFFTADPNSHKFSICLIVVVAGITDSHPEKSPMWNERANSHKVSWP